MSPADRRALVDRDDPALPVVAQCRLLKIARSTLYYQPAPVEPGRSGGDAADGRAVSGLAVLRIAPNGGGVAARGRGREPQTGAAADAGDGAGGDLPEAQHQPGHPDHKVYPYLLRGLIIDRPNQVWCADITYIPMAKGFVYLVAVMDWFSRRVLSWRLSITMEADFCVEAVQEAMARHGRPEIFNTDQGVQFTSAAFLDELEAAGVRISMDGKGRFLDNIFIERLWRSLKYEEVFIKAYGSVTEARRGIGGWLSFYNEERPHQALGYRTPRAVFAGAACEHVDNASASLRDAPALPTCSQAHHQEKEVIMY